MLLALVRLVFTCYIGISLILAPVRNNLWDWQSLQPTSGSGAQFFDFCDALEVKNGVSASAKGWGLDHALTAWGSYFKNTYISERK